MVSKKIKKLILFIAFFAIVLCLVFGRQDKIKSLRVVTMPELVNTEYAQKLLLDMWREVEPNIKLEFVEREYDSVEYPKGIDVLVFDFNNIRYLSSLGYFREYDLSDIDAYDYLIAFAKENMVIDEKIYGVPQFACENFLVYHKDDKEIDNVQNLVELCEVLDKENAEGLPITVDANKIWIDLSDHYTYYALDAILDENGTYIPFNQNVVKKNLPDVYDIFDYVNDRSIAKGKGDTSLVAFGSGRGRAIMCYSENIGKIGLPIEELSIKPISFSNSFNIPLNYIDAVAISSDVKDDERYKKCLKLVNLMTGKDYIEKLLTYNGEPQYIIPVREDVFCLYAEKYPLYEKLYKLMTERKVFQFSSGNEDINKLVDYIKEYKKGRS